MLILSETPAGYVLWRVTNEGVLSKEDLCAEYPTADDAQKILTLHQFSPFESTTEAVESLAAIQNSQLSEPLTNFLKENIISQGIHEKLQVADAALSRIIKDELGIQCVAPAGQEIPEIFRLIRSNLQDMLPTISEETYKTLELGISHSLATKTLKFSPSKVDSMIVSSVNLLEDLEKEINNYGMRVREWYGWHFPELSHITSDNLLYSKLVLKMGRREGAMQDLSDLLTEPMVEEVQKVAMRSMGTELSDDDLFSIQGLATQVVELIEYRNKILDYIRQRMRAIAPNLSELVGESLGARLIAHAGSLSQLAKAAGSTVQVFGAEKALFRAIKENKKTPKYGLIYAAQLVSHTDQKLKGRVSRSLASKISLSTRVDAYSEEPDGKIGIQDRGIIENHVKQLEGEKVSKFYSRSRITEEPKKIVVEQTPNYHVENDFTIEEEQPKKKHRKKRHHKKEGEAAAEAPAE